jgi:hypothetical protein
MRNSRWKRFATDRLSRLKVVGLIAALWAGFAARAPATTVSYDLRVSESLPVVESPNNMHAQMMAAWTTPVTLAMERNRPYFLLQNTSTLANGGDGTAELTSFSMTIGDTSQTFDWSRVVLTSPGVTATLVTPDRLDNHSKNDVVTYNFTGLTPGKIVLFHVDIDPKLPTADPFSDYRHVLFTLNGGANTANNSKTSATFVDNNQTINADPTPWNNPIDNGPTVFGMQFVSHYMDDHVASYLTGNVATVPEPASVALAGLGIVGLIFGSRRFR